VTVVETVLAAIAVVSLAYFTLFNVGSIVFTALAWGSITRHLRERRHAALDEAMASPLTPGVSVLLPAFDEEAGIVESVRSLLALRYPRHEVIVVNDGSTDATLERLAAEFDLAPVRKALRDGIATAPVRGTYVSRRRRELVVVDKLNGGKADALNAGINAASHPYVCAVDADALIEADALMQVAKPILDDPELVVATGGIVRIVNGCTVDHGRVVRVALPRSRLATVQVLEYFRGFLIGRVGWSRVNALLIISGAFGLFRRSLVESAGGWWTRTVGEDVELVVRLHHELRRRDEPYRIAFVPDPVCWTEAPEDLRTLSRQRRRWHRGLLQTLGRHRGAIGNPRYGVFGTVALPYFVVFELLGPVLEAIGPLATLAAWLLGELSTAFLVAFVLAAFAVGIVLSAAAVALEEFTFRRHPRAAEVARLLLYAVVENVGYRQLNGYWRLLGLVDAARRKQGWGAQRRRGLGRQLSSPGRE
jgi:cellulose synthase/poly-beta-1,6-N-acetylglucosamine synthase-like glycosyltransferase